MYTLDWFLVIAINGSIILVGLWLARNTNNSVDWFLAAKGLPWWMVGLSMFATAVDSGDYVAVAGGAYDIEVMKSVVDRLGVPEICIAYGLTEASPGVTMTRVQDPLEVRVQTVGRALPNVEVKIIEPDSGKTLSAGVQGELCTRGYHVMTGYYKMPEATAQAVDEEGWLHTGDLAVMDESGDCRITGRSKDMIIRGGENIYPREVEEFLYTHPKIKDVQVVGIPSSRWGEEVAAFIQLKSGEEVGEEEIREYCVDQISYYKVPSLFFFVQDYPTTASGKIQKYKLREQAIQELAREQDALEEGSRF